MARPLQLDRLDHLPRALLDIEPREITGVLPNPSLIQLDAANDAGKPPLFLSVLLHGNETTGFFVLQNLIRSFEQRPLLRPLMIFVGNVDAAASGLRTLPGEADFNRVWAGGDGPEAMIAAEVTAAAMAAEPFASIDIHNNSGANPLYGCVNALAPEGLQLASLFSRICVYYTNPSTTQSVAFTRFCPAVTLECGQPGDAEGVARATQFVLDVLHLDHLEEASRAARDMTLYHTVGRIVVDPEIAFSFDEDAAPLWFPNEFEKLNFSALPPGAPIAFASSDDIPLRVVDEAGADLTDNFFRFDDGAVRLARPATPAMLTSIEAIIRQDCLGYLMEEIDTPPALARAASAEAN